MKNVFIFFISFLMFSAALAANDHAFALFNNGATFYVIFDDNPELKNEDVFSKGISIGRVISRDLSEDNMVEVKIEIKDKMKHLITENTCFVVENGSLSYDQVKKGGKPLEKNSKIRGFLNRADLNWFITKTTAKEVGGTVVDKAGEIGGVVVDKAKELYNDAVKEME